MKPDGSAYIKRVVFSKPGRLDVKQSVNFKQGRSENYLLNAVKRMRPVAAKKILRAARALLRPF